MAAAAVGGARALATPGATQGYILEAARAATLACHSGASLVAAAGGHREAARLLRAAEALTRAAVAQLLAPSAPASAAQEAEQKQKQKPRRRKRGKRQQLPPQQQQQQLPAEQERDGDLVMSAASADSLAELVPSSSSAAQGAASLAAAWGRTFPLAVGDRVTFHMGQHLGKTGIVLACDLAEDGEARRVRPGVVGFVGPGRKELLPMTCDLAEAVLADSGQGL